MTGDGESKQPFRRPTTLAIEIARHLRDAIIRGDVRPGDRLNESKVTQTLGSSRSPVREAFRILDTEGLVSAAARSCLAAGAKKARWAGSARAPPAVLRE